jgi:hypothetical protein
MHTDTFEENGDVWLEAGHICIKKELAMLIYDRSEAILSVYNPQERTFIAAAADEPVYATLSRMKRIPLKTTGTGDRRIPVQELLSENGVSGEDRILAFVEHEAMHMLKIRL